MPFTNNIILIKERILIMRYPKFLKDNGTIGFVAPSFGCATEPYYSAFLNAQKKFKEMGYSCKLGDNCYASDGIGISSTPQNCGKELTEMYCDTDSDVLISCGGGELMCETIGFVDFEKIAQAEPKWYMGYSDNTNFTFLETTLCDTAAIYGSCAATFGMDTWHAALNDAFGLLTGKQAGQSLQGLSENCSFKLNGYDGWEKESLKSEENPTAVWNITEPTVIKAYKGNKSVADAKLTFSGRLLGGCMDCLVNLLGTKYDKVKEFNKKYEKDGVVWFLESCDLNVFSIRRAMWQMKNAGWFDNAKGFIIGRPLVFGQEIMGLDQYNAVTGIIGDMGLPIIMDIDLGHLAPTMPIISGSIGEVTVKGNEFAVEMKLIK